MAHILVADDDDIAADLVSGILSSAGHVCAQADNAQAVFSMLHWRLPDLLLLDSAMPGKGGASVMHRLRSSPAWRGVPVILFAAGGPHDVIAKPVQPRLLLSKVERIIAASALDSKAEFQLRIRKGDTPRKVYL